MFLLNSGMCWCFINGSFFSPVILNDFAEDKTWRPLLIPQNQNLSVKCRLLYVNLTLVSSPVYRCVFVFRHQPIIRSTQESCFLTTHMYNTDKNKGKRKVQVQRHFKYY